MQIEIKELVIKTTINDSSNPSNNKVGISEEDLKKLKKEILYECVESMTQMLRRINER